MCNMVTNVYVKFNYNRLCTDKALGKSQKSDNNNNNNNNNKHKSNVCRALGHLPGPKTDPYSVLLLFPKSPRILRPNHLQQYTLAYGKLMATEWTIKFNLNWNVLYLTAYHSAKDSCKLIQQLSVLRFIHGKILQQDFDLTCSLNAKHRNHMSELLSNLLLIGYRISLLLMLIFYQTHNSTVPLLLLLIQPIGKITATVIFITISNIAKSPKITRLQTYLV